VSFCYLGGDALQVTITEMLVRLVAVLAIFIFVGNSGIISFGHVGFMCIGAYASAWATLSPSWKQMMLPGLPLFLQDNQFNFLTSVCCAALLAGSVGLVLGLIIMRLSGIGASIATFAFLAIVNSVYSNWDSVTAGTSSVVGIPTEVGPWQALYFVAIVIIVVVLYQRSSWGLMLRASREDEVAARGSGIQPARVRLIAFVLSATVSGLAGGLYAHFLGILTADTFYLNLSFITLSMLVVGGIRSLSGAIVGVLSVTLLIEVLRYGEGGISFGTLQIGLPHGTQEIGLGVFMALVLIIRPSGLTGGREYFWSSRS
jgi:branched-chain amino acid transport system permease protein